MSDILPVSTGIGFNNGNGFGLTPWELLQVHYLVLGLVMLGAETGATAVLLVMLLMLARNKIFTFFEKRLIIPLSAR